MDYAGFYINLENQPDRCLQIEGELARQALAYGYTRFDAVAGNGLGVANPHLSPAEIGRFSSHYLVLKDNLETSRPLHIVEDDVVFSAFTERAIHWAISQNVLSHYDVLHTDVFMPLLNDAYKIYKKFYDRAVMRDARGNLSRVNFEVIDLKDQIFAGSNSYVVNRLSVGKLHDLMAEALNHEPALPIDAFIRQKTQEGAIRSGCLLPFVTTIRIQPPLSAEDGTFAEGHLSMLAANLARQSFFVGCDMDHCQQYLKEYLPLPPIMDAHQKILNHLLAFSITDAYRPL